MENIINNMAKVFNAVAYYLMSAISLVTSNKYFLGLTVLMLLMVGKSFKVGRLVSARG